MVKDTKAIVEVVTCPESGKIYLAPCQVRCPLKLNIQRSHTALSQLGKNLTTEQMIKIGDEIFQENPLFPIICGNICGLCEEECNYKDETGAIRRRKIIWPIGKEYLKYLDKVAKFPAPKKDKVAVIGAGPSGLMCAFELSKRGYKVTIFEKNAEIGGALRYIPKYRLPKEVSDSLLNNIVRIANLDIKTGVKIGKDGKNLDDLEKMGYKAVFMATGTPSPRILTIESETPEFKQLIQSLVDGDETHGIKFGINLLYDVDRGDVSLDLYKGKKVIVIGGGNVAFDVGRTAKRLGGDITIMCLECSDKECKDGIPADLEEIEGAEEEGIKIIYSRGVDGIITNDKGEFQKIKTLRCKEVFTDDGRFCPSFDHKDIDYLEGDVLLITIGQGVDRSIFQSIGLLNDKGRIEYDPITLMSKKKDGVFFGGDVNRIGFASEAMRDGYTAAESIDRYLSGKDMKKGRVELEFEEADIPKRALYKAQPKLEWKSPKDRMNFEPFEKDYSWDEVIEEATRCLYCGPCLSCKACVFLDYVKEIPDIEVNEDLCSGCAVCIGLCPYGALSLKEGKDHPVAVIDKLKCKRCGSCVTACPSTAITIKDDFNDKIKNIEKVKVEVENQPQEKEEEKSEGILVRIKNIFT